MTRWARVGRYVFVKEPDPGRDIIISTLLFDMPS